jgi:hypothetical protein
MLRASVYYFLSKREEEENMSTRKITEIIKTDVALISTNITAGSRSNKYVDMSGSQRIAAVVVAMVSKTCNFVLQLYQATDADGSDAKVLGSPVTVTNASGLKRECIGRVEAQAQDMDTDNDFTFVGVNADANEAIAAMGVFLRSDLLYANVGADAESYKGASPTSTTIAPTTTGA